MYPPQSLQLQSKKDIEHHADGPFGSPSKNNPFTRLAASQAVNFSLELRWGICLAPGPHGTWIYCYRDKTFIQAIRDIVTRSNYISCRQPTYLHTKGHQNIIFWAKVMQFSFNPLLALSIAGFAIIPSNTDPVITHKPIPVGTSLNATSPVWSWQQSPILESRSKLNGQSPNSHSD